MTVQNYLSFAIPAKGNQRRGKSWDIVAPPVKIKMLSTRRRNESGNKIRRPVRGFTQRHTETEKIFGVHVNQYGAAIASNFMSLKSCSSFSLESFPLPNCTARNWPSTAKTKRPST